jgi:hypothetical protein
MAGAAQSESSEFAQFRLEKALDKICKQTAGENTSMNTRLTGLFLGAGASYEAGMPLVWELTAEIKNWLTPNKLRELNQEWRLQGGGHPDAVIEDVATVLQMENLHYENILGYVETQYQRHNGLQQHYHHLYSWLVDLVYQLLYFRQVNNDRYLDGRLHFYEGIRSLAEKNSPLWVFSLNHDLVVEAIAARFAIPIHSGFSGELVTLPRRDSSGVKRGELRAEVLTKHDLENGVMYFPSPAQSGIYLLKIHGALDVFTFNEGADLLKLVPGAPGLSAVTATLRAANEELLYALPGAPGGKVHTTNEISYADEQGVMQFLRKSLLAGVYKFDEKRSQVLPKSLLKHFRQNLNFVSTLVCIGYGFGDIHINQILRQWLEFTPDRRLEIVNPNAKDIPTFIMHLAPQVTLVESGATDYLDAIAGIKRSRRDELEKQVAALARGKERMDSEMTEFLNLDNERRIAAFIEKIGAFRVKKERGNLDSIGSPESVVNEWADEIQGTTEDMLERLLRFLKGAR